ncbi:MAG TPA: hypothetical protein VEB64_05770 [Azospirillaceae bacterium]|nr:hypothetical protein [Azospirillaceae bacterium]
MSNVENPAESSTGATPASVPAASTAGEAGVSRSTHFLFEHKVFSISGAHFSLTHDTRQPVYNVMLGDLQAAIPFETLRNAFDIPLDSHDSSLLDIVEKSLRFVKVIRPGETIPRELLDGTASWQVEDKHRHIAKGRLTVQLVSWISGSEHIVVDITQLEQLVEDPGTKARLQMAFTEIAKKLGYGEERKQEVTDRVDDLAHELAYVEALRDRYALIRGINDKLGMFSRVFRTDRTISQELSRILGLMKKPLKEFDFILDECDAQTGEIVAALKKFDAQVAYIRQVRDELHWKLMDWDDVISDWQELPLVRDTKTENTIKGLYRFLASKYLETKVWERR